MRALLPRARVLLLALLGALALAWITAAPALADERILSYDSDVTVEPDGDFLVRETIRLRAEGMQISRGIFRDFPILVHDGQANRRVGFELISATRDGRPEPHRIIEGARAIRIYLGDPDKLLRVGDYTYQLVYRSDRQLRSFSGHDEVYWNATGTEWLFPIDHAQVTVHLPDGAQIQNIATYTGPFGATGSTALARQTGPQSIAAETTQPLAAREGLTIAVGFDKGLISPPNRARDWFLRDHRIGLWALGGLALVLGYYLLAWWLGGRDPARGVIVPRWEPPAGLSAAMTRLAWKNELPDADEALSLTTVEAASRGLIALDRNGTTTTLTTGKTAPPKALPEELRLLLSEIETADGSLAINKTNGSVIARLQNSLVASLKRQRQSLRLYRKPGFWRFLGLALSMGVVTTVMALLPPPLDFTLGVIAVLGLIVSLLLRVAVIGARRKQRRIGPLIILAIGLAILIPLLGLCARRYLLDGGEVLVPFAIGAVILTNLIFLPILGGPTRKGREVLDQIEGLQDYIEIAEKDRLNLPQAPQMSVSHFERILPFAMALNLETQWVRRFRDWIQTATAGAGTDVTASTLHSFGGLSDHYRVKSGSGAQPSLERQLARSLTSALPIASSSSSGSSSGGSSSGSSGGGSSGGGGGGGGGGGW